MARVLKQLLVAGSLIYYCSCSNERRTSNTDQIPQDSLQSYYNLVSITSDNDYIYPIPFSMGSNVTIGKGVNLADPDDPYITKENFFTVNTAVPVTPVRSTWSAIKSVSIQSPNEVTAEDFRKSSESSYLETESDEQMAMHIYANFKGRFGLARLSAAMDFVRSKRQYGHLILFNQEVNVAKSNKMVLKQSPSIQKEVGQINDFPKDEQRLSHFISKFGSHYITDITFGSRIFMYCYVHSTDERVKTSVSIAFKNFSIDANAGGQYEKILRENSVEIKMRVYGGEGTVDQIFDNIDQIKEFFIKYNKGEYKVTLAPIACRVLSYRSELNPKEYPNLERLFTPYKGMRTISPFGVPPGTIIAWYPPTLERDKQKKKLTDLVPDGWRICDGTDNTPDLTLRFIYGTQDINTIGEIGGKESHIHSISMSVPTNERSDRTWLPGDRVFTINAESNIPPYLKLVYIIKK
jgi:hypothetical protein